MKRFYLYNTLYLLFAFIFFFLIKINGFFMAVLIRQDIPYFVIVLPLVLGIGIFGIFYQLFAINFKDPIGHNIQKIVSIITTIYIMIIFLLFPRIILTTTNTLQGILFAIPSGLIIQHIFLKILNKNAI